MFPEILRPLPSSTALADENAIGAMQRALTGLSAIDLENIKRRCAAYLVADIPLPDMYRLDRAALGSERARRRAFANIRAEAQEASSC